MFLQLLARGGTTAAIRRSHVQTRVLSALPISRRQFHMASDSMRVGLSSEQEEMMRMAEEFGAAEFAPHAEEWDRTKFFPVDQLRAAAQLGFGGLYVREDVGGTGLGRLDGAVVFEALAKSCVSTTAYLTIHNMCGWMVDRYGSEEQRQRFLPGMVSMDLFASYCLTEPGSGSDAASLRTKAVKKGSNYILNGSKAFISGGSRSDVYLVMAQTEHDGITCFIVEKNSPGLSFGAQEDKLGWNSQPTCEVVMEDCVVPEENLLGGAGNGFKIAMAGLDGGRINIGTCSVGGAQRALEEAIGYTKVRQQFGKPISAFQNTQFTLADMATELHAARCMVRSAARLLDAKDPLATSHCAMAKRYATDVGFKVTDRAMQLHGGYGYLKDYPIERIFRDLRVHQILEGTNEIMKVIISRSLLKD